jgi:DegV family protein with EDD domain
MKIIADTPTLYSPEEGRELNLTIVPACTIIGDKVYKDFEDINSEEFLKLIEEGAVPTTSQPAIGDMLDVFEESNEEALVLTIGDGLSGTYQTALGAKNSIEENEHIHVVDTKTLAGPQRYLVQKAMKLREEGIGIERIKEELIKCIETSVSFVIPEDFEFLKRSGRLTPIAAKLATIIKIVPVLTQTEDKKRITLFTVKRSKKKALESIMDHLEALGVNKEYFISVSHAGTPEAAANTLARLKERFAGIHAEMFQLAPALITHGGPGCVVIQAIHK